MNFKTVLILIVLCAAPSIYGQDSKSNYKSLYKEKIDLTKGTGEWARNIASIVFEKSIPEDKKITEFYVMKKDNDLLVNQETPLKSGNLEDGKEFSTNCQTLKKSCRSEKCVADTLIEILGDGDRNVLIKYERKLLSVQIYYTYQDC